MRACDYSVFKIQYNTTFHERVSTYGGMDSELTGKMITETRSYLCVAPDENFARTAFNRYHSSDELLSVENVGQLNDIVRLQ